MLIKHGNPNTLSGMLALPPIYDQLAKMQEMHDAFSKADKILSIVNKALPSIQRIQNTLDKIAEREAILQKSHQRLFIDTPEHLRLIAKYGWFLDFDTETTLPNELFESHSLRGQEAIDEALISYYGERTNEIIETLKFRHPNRFEIFEEIQFAFENKKYLLSIPCILSQIDGICFDFNGKKFFDHKKSTSYQSAVVVEIQKLSSEYLNVFLSPVTVKSPISAHERDLGSYPVRLNRNEILHGVEANYGTEINNLKCLSLLKYISDLLGSLSDETVH